MRGLRDFQDRVAVITGASSGIGAGLSRALAERGARTVLIARRADKLAALAEEIRAKGGVAEVVPCDVGDRQAVDAAAQQVIERLGRVDLLINNAGHNQHVLFKDQDVAEIERMMRVNFLGMVYWIKAVLPAMRSQGRGWIVNLSSLAGRLGQPDEVAYSATKFAVTGFSEGLSYELDPLGIHVLCVYPALVRTEMFDERTLSRMPEQAKRSFLSVEEFCAAVLAALERGAYEVTVPQRYGFVYLIRLLLPGVFRRSMARLRLPLLPELTR